MIKDNKVIVIYVADYTLHFKCIRRQNIYSGGQIVLGHHRHDSISPLFSRQTFKNL